MLNPHKEEGATEEYADSTQKGSGLRSKQRGFFLSGDMLGNVSASNEVKISRFVSLPQ